LASAIDIEQRIIPMQLVRTRAAGLCLAAFLAAPTMAAAQSESDGEGEAAAENPVVAVVNGEKIRFQEVKDSAQDLPPQYQKQFSRIFPALLDRVIDMRLLGEKAAEAGLGDDPEVEARVAEAKTQIMSQVYLERKREERITDDRLEKAYQAYRKKNPAKDQVRARHILVKKEQQANDLIAKLDEGANFGELAKKHSTGPSGKKGGDLGFFGKDKMVEPFTDAAFKLDAGEYTANPVKTQFGWHVIKVEEKRRKEPKSFEEMKGQLRQQLRRQVTQSVLKDMRKGEDVTTYPERAPGVNTGGSGQGMGTEQGAGQSAN
jgi:peptidyl-prolyl cis-trans isomerase C